MGRGEKMFTSDAQDYVKELRDDNKKDNFEKGKETFQRLLVASDEIIKNLPDDFNHNKELEEARKEKYGM